MDDKYERFSLKLLHEYIIKMKFVCWDMSCPSAFLLLFLNETIGSKIYIFNNKLLGKKIPSWIAYEISVCCRFSFQLEFRVVVMNERL